MSVLLLHCPLLTIQHICDDLAWELAPSLASSGFFPLMFGQRAKRSLLETRRCTSFFSSVKGSGPVVSTLPSDFGGGAVRQTAGVSIVGSQPYVTNFNMQLSRVSLELCSQAATRLRRDFGVQVRDLSHIGAQHCSKPIKHSNAGDGAALWRRRNRDRLQSAGNTRQ